jgi:hypothetical protein
MGRGFFGNGLESESDSESEYCTNGISLDLMKVVVVV